MIRLNQALNLIFENSKQLPVVKVALGESIGMVLAEDLYSGIAMPPFKKSAMDGYAVRANDLKKVPVKLSCLGSIEAGNSFNKVIKPGQCVKIMTGAPIPDGADSVVMVEDTNQEKDLVEIRKKIAKGKNICLKGEDIEIGKKVLHKGRVILVSDISLIASIGRSHIRAIRKPRVAILNTGGEIVPVGRKLSKNKIYNSNGPQLLALLSSDRVETNFLGISKDEPRELEQAISEGLKYDLLLISGGVSMGDYDFIPSILEKVGVRKIFHKVKVKPGKPLFFGVKKERLVFGIPGNPVSNFLTYQVFIRPALRKMMGLDNYEPDIKEGTITKTFKTKGKRKHFVPVKIIDQSGKYCLSLLNSHGSADIVTLSEADGFMIIDIGKTIIEKGSIVEFITWKTI